MDDTGYKHIGRPRAVVPAKPELITMPTLKIYSPSMQPELERIFETCFAALGWEYEPHGRHADILDIEKTYMESGCMWCLFEGGKIIGASAVRTIAPGVAEMKRLYVLPEYQGKGINAVILNYMIEEMVVRDIEFCETNLNLEDNSKVQSQWGEFETIQHKRRRCYIKDIK